ncbi:MAG: heme o synthase [Candidatus Binatia bacterium]
MMPALKPVEEFGLASDVLPLTQRRAADFLELTKPRIVTMVALTALFGYYLAPATAAFDWIRLIVTLVGTSLAAAGTMTLNQYLERDLDAQMLRTRQRPLPDGRVAPFDALVFGTALTIVGILLLLVAVNPLSAAVTAATSISYLFAYTPLKTRTSLCTLVGAVPGALPPLTGWAAASGSLDVSAWAVFAIMFVWQIPHSLAIAQMYRDDYARGGFALLPVVDPDGTSTARQILTYSLALVSVGMVPTLLGLAGPIYFAASIVLGFGMLAPSYRLARSAKTADARRVMFASLIYLPVLFAIMAADKLPSSPW